MNELTREEKNRKLAEWLFGRNLDGFGIYSAQGSRIRERDFDSREEAQRYIDSEDERLQPPHKSSARGVNIQPCVKAHPDFYASESANALLLDKFPEPELWLEDGLWYCQPNYMQDGPDTNPNYILSCDADRKTCVAEAGVQQAALDLAKSLVEDTEESK